MILEDPVDFLPNFDRAALRLLATKNPSYADKIGQDFRVRLVGLPTKFESSQFSTNMNNKFIELAVSVKSVSSREIVVMIAAFRCLSHHLTFVNQPIGNPNLIRPKSCQIKGCYATSGFTLDEKESLIDDFQKASVKLHRVGQSEAAPGLQVYLTGDLVGSLHKGRTYNATGVLRIKMTAGKKLGYVFEANSVQPY